MNPDRNQGGMTVSTLMSAGVIASTAIPVVFFVLIGFASLLHLDQTTMALIIIVSAFIVLVSVLIVNYLVQRRIKERWIGLMDVCSEYTSGDRSVRAPVNGDDVFARVSMAFNMVLDSQSSGAPSLSSSSSDAAALQAQIEKLLQEVSAVGDGDLRVQAEVTPDTLGVLADSFNYMIEELAKVVGRVQSTAVQVTNATRRILDRSAELAQATEAQVQQISQTSEAVEALASFIQNVARNAQLSAEMAQEALRSASNGQQAVRQTIEGMMQIRENVQETSKKIKRLGERSNEIGEIVRIIEDIADQTNLLALNAAIQSAMAGEHGRGFAVVADEIRLLAERSTESTKRIATLVKSIQGDTYEAVVAMEDSTQEVVKGSQLADEAGRSLNSIYSAVERQTQMIESIARTANEQTSVSEAVAVAMGRISEITRQTDAGTQEAAVSVSYLAELSEQLRASVSTFRLPERINEGVNSFSSMTSISEIPDSTSQQRFDSGSMDNDWSQGFSGSFPPLPEPGNSGSLLALGSPSGNQFSFSNQQDLGNQSGFGGQPQFGFSNQQSFGNLPSLSNPPSFGGQPSSFSGPTFGGFPDFRDSDAQEEQGSFGGNGFGSFGNPQFGGNGFSGQGQSGFAPTPQMPLSPASNSGMLSQASTAQQGQQGRPRWSGNLQGNQNQFSFQQDQVPFQSNS